MSWYEGQGSTEILAQKALQIITIHKATARSNGEAELYMDKFENALQDLDDLETTYDPMMAKINFLTILKTRHTKLERKH